MKADRREIEHELLAWMREEEPARDEARFARLASALFAWQVEHNPVYGRFCRGRGCDAERLGDWREIPLVPTGAFKEVPLRCFPEAATRKVFRTSGTTAERRGELHLDTLELYEASLVASFERGLLPDRRRPGQRTRMLVLAASPEEAPDSSLSHMFGVMRERRGDGGSGFFLREGRLDAHGLVAALEAAVREGCPVLVCGTAFAFVHALDHLRERGLCLPLPAGSRVMETGGFKGRSREVARETLLKEIEAALGVEPERVVNQYGMTELGSQFYDATLLDPAGPRRKLEPPWARVRIVDPESGREAPDGEVGAIGVVDLANTGSVLAVATSDLGRRVGNGFEVLGRDEGAEERGCSIAADELLRGR